MTVQTTERTKANAARKAANVRVNPGSELDEVGVYLRQIGAVDLLTAIEEVDLSQAIEAGLCAQHHLDAATEGDPRPGGHARTDLAEVAAAGRDANRRMVEANLRLVVSVARKYGWTGVPMLDLVQEGNLGLVHAVEKFDYSKGYKFSTYATWWIRQAIDRGHKNTSRTVRVPTQHHDDWGKVRRVQREYLARADRHPTNEEAADATGLSPERVAELIGIFRPISSLDEPVAGDGEAVLGEFVADLRSGLGYEEVEDQVDGVLRTRLIQEAFSELPPAGAQVLRFRHGFGGEPLTVKETARRLGMNADAVTRIERDAESRLRGVLTADDLREWIA